ncbi:MAG: hypothetical protein JW816_00080 [Candidatus Buchananbacteria bacterium]|nr:hypothetical protein [Candidatus Buchananbacteria bacterium]
MTSDSNQSDQQYSQMGVILEFQEKMAVIQLSDGQKILWPIKNLPDDAAQNQKIKLTTSTNQSEENEREKIAKTILNQILKKEPNL